MSDSSPRVIVFHSGGKRYSASMDRVVSVLSHPEVMPIPDSPPWLRGVLGLEGKAVYVVELEGVPQSPQQKQDVIVLRVGSTNVGVFGRVLPALSTPEGTEPGCEDVVEVLERLLFSNGREAGMKGEGVS